LAAGRTDSGVHALGQVANFMTESKIPCEKLRLGLQNFLPDDVIVRDVAEADPDFHATYSAKRKRYRYVIHNDGIQVPFLRRYVYHFRGRLDSAAMDAAAQVLLGTHDFRCFESQFPNKATSVRTVTEATVDRYGVWPLWSQLVVNPDPRDFRNPGDLTRADGEFIWFDIVADGFLYNMVRAIVGTLLKVGRGQWSAEDVGRILENQDRSQAGETAPAHGLYLVSVEY
jgi:tRNA pseudouridine38-40 synthase